MQLNEIFEENSARTISKKTNISEENIEALLARDFNKLTRVKALGFISILEREYKADISALRKEALSYYDEHSDDESVTLGLPLDEERKGKPKWFLLLILGLLGYASWYFFTQFDKKQLSQLLPFSEEKITQTMVPKDENREDLSIEKVTAPVETESSIAAGTEIQVQSISIEDETNSSSIY
jgi:cytoskeletal protein RodZ